MMLTTSEKLAISDYIRARREACNAAILTHDARMFALFAEDDISVTAGDGSLLLGRKVLEKNIAAQFKSAADHVYVRTPTEVEVSDEGDLTAETGKWIGRWKESGAHRETGGSYFAMWRKNPSDWLIRSEIFVTLY